VREALVHIEPIKKEQPSLWDRMAEDIRRLAEGMGLGMHDLHIHTDMDEGYVVEIHLEFSDQVNLLQAHNRAEQFEQEVQRNWPDIKEIITHLEPIPHKLLGLESSNSIPKEEHIREVISSYVDHANVRSLQLYQTGDHLHANLVLMLSGETPLIDAHELAEEIELGLRSQIQSLSHVIVHLEPEPEKV